MTNVAAAPQSVIQKPLAAIGNWRIWDDRRQSSAHDNVARDARMGHAIARGEARPTLRLWENVQALVVSRKDTALPGFAAAAELLASEGWPVVVRETGGSAVPHGPGVLQLSLVMPRSLATDLSIDTLFQQLCQPIQMALATLGIASEYGRVPAAFCDGRYNLVVAGKKIAGTAQVWRANIGRDRATKEGYVLAHASLFVDVDKAVFTQVVNRFYALAGADVMFDENALTTVLDCHSLSEKTGSVQLVDSVRSGIICSLSKILEQ